MVAHRRKVQVTPLIDLDTSTFAAPYQQGLCWFLFEQQDHTGPLFDEDVVATFKNFTYAGLFHRQQEPSLRQAVGSYLGTIHAGVLSPLTGQLRPGVTTLVAIRNQNAVRGYRAGREWFFVDADPWERRFTESRWMEHLRGSVTEMVHWKDGEPTWFFAIGCLLGEFSGQLFPMTQAEQEVYLPQRQRLGEARQRHRDAQKHLAKPGMRVPVL
jgi:hypothetical protein